MTYIEYVLGHHSLEASHLKFVGTTESGELEALLGCFRLYCQERYNSEWHLQNLWGDGDNDVAASNKLVGIRNDILHG